MLETCQSFSAWAFSAATRCGCGMAEHIHRDAAHEVEVARAVARNEPGALASLEGKVDPLIG